MPQIETKCLTVVAAAVEAEDTVDSVPSCVRVLAAALPLDVARRLAVVAIFRIVVELTECGGVAAVAGLRVFLVRNQVGLLRSTCRFCGLGNHKVLPGEH